MSAWSRRIGTALRRAGRGIASRAAFAAMLLGAATPSAGAGKSPVAVQLVLALDASASVDAQEFRLQLDGLAAAFSSPEVIHAVETLRPLGVAVAVVQWGGHGDTRMVLPFTLLQNGRDAKAFGFRVSLIPRWLLASSTSIADAIGDSRALIEASEFAGGRRTIDVSGDGRDNGGGNLAAARRMAVEDGIVINGLPITADDPGLADYYRDRVIAGTGAFVAPAVDFADFARAIREKLTRELNPEES